MKAKIKAETGSAPAGGRITYESGSDQPQPVDHGAVGLRNALQIVDGYVEKREALDSGSVDKATGKRVFSFCRSSSTYIEISVDDEASFTVVVELPVQKGIGFVKWTDHYLKEIRVQAVDELKELVRRFFELDVAEYREYFDKRRPG